MSFSTDKQTADELNLLNKFRQGSVYHLFNRVKTRGGEQLLDSMFRQPLTDTAVINGRSQVFRFFQQVGLSFPFDVQQVSGMREYLDSNAGKNAALAWAGIFLKKSLAGITRDGRYRKIVQGLQATIVTVQHCYEWTQTVSAAIAGGASALPPGNPWHRRLAAIKELLADSRLEKLRNTDIYQPLPIKTLAYYEHLLKGSLQREMEDLLQYVYETDVYITVSGVARQRSFCYGRALPPEDNRFFASGLYHPAVSRPAGNTLLLDGSSNVLFLTGANMAGKSTLMKSMGIALYLAHMGFPLAAEELEFSVREGLFTSINVADNIGLGYSHFYAEVVRVKQAAEAAVSGRRLVFMFDELFKGTNVKDAFEGTLAVTEGFAAYRNCLFIVSTHIIEAGEALRGLENIRFAYMPTVMDGPNPRYTYRLEEGITEDRQGMLIIRNEGILQLLEEAPSPAPGTRSARPT